MDISCTFCLTGTRPDDEDPMLGKRSPIEESEGGSEGEDDDEEERIYAGLNGKAYSKSDENDSQMTDERKKFKLVKNSDNDIAVEFKEPAPESQIEKMHIEIIQKSKEITSPVHSNPNPGIEGQKITKTDQVPSPFDEVSKTTTGETPLKEKDHNQAFADFSCPTSQCQASQNKGYFNSSEQKVELQSCEMDKATRHPNSNI